METQGFKIIGPPYTNAPRKKATKGFASIGTVYMYFTVELAV